MRRLRVRLGIEFVRCDEIDDLGIAEGGSCKMKACITGCDLSCSLHNLWLGIGALKIQGTYSNNGYCALDYICILCPEIYDR